MLVFKPVIPIRYPLFFRRKLLRYARTFLSKYNFLFRVIYITDAGYRFTYYKHLAVIDFEFPSQLFENGRFILFYCLLKREIMQIIPGNKTIQGYCVYLLT